MITRLLRFLKLIPTPPPPCQHRTIRDDRWNAQDGCPMIRKTCLDCDKIMDEGHVYANEPWTPEECIPRIRRL